MGMLFASGLFLTAQAQQYDFLTLRTATAGTAMVVLPVWIFSVWAEAAQVVAKMMPVSKIFLISTTL